MTRFIKCPICNNQAKREYYTGPFGIDEEYINCSTCNYEFEFVYGNYKEVVGNKMNTIPPIMPPVARNTSPILFILPLAKLLKVPAYNKILQ